jgi:hypothetical protein
MTDITPRVARFRDYRQAVGELFGRFGSTSRQGVEERSAVLALPRSS